MSIIAENRKVGTTETLIYYIYDALGISGMRYNDQNYYYLKNTLGDIIGIKDETGAQVATYTYDSTRLISTLVIVNIANI
ncbi:MAG: hypothetical protein IJW43_03360 [Clostridia bacterium]|nr:hypothetical protein [Clostridia bacterium]